MSATPSPSPRARRLAFGLCGLGVVLHGLTRLLHPVTGFGNADIAGILYEADIINDGLLPYHDTADFKSPGTFFLVAAVFRLVARELWAVKLVYAGWALLAAPAIWLAARALYGADDRGTIAAGGAVLLYLLSIGVFDQNYSAWMTPAYAWAFACLLLALRGRPWLHLAAGLFAGLAFLLKTHALVLAPAFACAWLWSRRRGDPGATASAAPLWLAGALLSLAPLAALYAARGALPALLRGILPVEDALAYAGRVAPETHWLWSIWWKVPLQMARAFPVQVALGAAALLAVILDRRAARRPGQVPEDMSRETWPIAPQLILLAWSVVGCGLGGVRYYVHYLPQYLPALALLAAHPAGWRWLLRRPEPTRRGLLRRAPALALLGLAAVLASIHLVQLARGKASRVDHRASDANAELGEFIRANTTPDECIQVWGWAAWPVYFYADRRACSPVFKVLGQVTDANQNSMFTRSRATDFKPGPLADLLLESFHSRPPAYVVRVRPFFPGVKVDPLDQFTALKQIIERDYVLREKIGRIYLLERLDRIPEPERTAAKKKALLDGARPAKIELRPVDKKKPATPPKPAAPPKPPPPQDDDDDDDPADRAP